MRRFFTHILIFQCILLQAQPVETTAKKQGYIKKKDEKTNKLIYEGEFKDDKPVGKFKYYYPNDSVRAIMNFKDGGAISYAKLFHPNGKRMGEGKYVKREIKDSVWTYYDEAGVLLSRDRYKLGKKNGASYVYLPDGSLGEEKHFKDDVQEGPFRQYFDGKNLRSQGNYLMGELTGRVVYYFPNGVEAAAGTYRRGLRTGAWIYKNQDGKITDKELYKAGVRADKKETEEFFSKNKPQEDLKSTGSKPAPGKKAAEQKKGK